MGVRKPIPIEEVERRLKERHGETLTIISSTYVGVGSKATFIDRDFGKWDAYVSNVLVGHGHVLRGKQRSQETNLAKYGSISPLGGKAIRKKIEVTNVERYGTSNVLGHGSPVRETLKATFQERYGVDNPQQIPEVRRRTLNTMVEKYGVQYPIQSTEIADKIKTTNLERYGFSNPWQSPDIRDKIEETCLERYGVSNPAQDLDTYKKTLDGLHLITKLVHWKTGETLFCRASYEVAFVGWCNDNCIDFDWQVPIKTPILTPLGRRSTYFIDAYIKDGVFADTWIELKGTWNRKNGHVGKAKWEWFHSVHSNSLLLTGIELRKLGIIGKKK